MIERERICAPIRRSAVIYYRLDPLSRASSDTDERALALHDRYARLYMSRQRY